MDNPVIVSAVRTPIGKFLGHARRHSGPKARGARRQGSRAPRGIEAGADRRSHHGQRGRSGARPEPRASSRDLRRDPRHGPRDDGQQGLRLEPQGGRARGAGDQVRRRGDRRRRRHGVDVERAVPHEERARRFPDGEPDHLRRDDPRRTVGRLQRLPHGKHRRGRRRALQRHARAARRLGRRQPPEGDRGDRRGDVQARDRRRRHPEQEGRPRAVRHRRIAAPRDDDRGAPRAEAGVQEGRNGHRGERPGGQRRRFGARHHLEGRGRSAWASRRGPRSWRTRRPAWRPSS